MRKRRNNSDESLDLLLDTITNTFGGLIFIALLIALLVGKKDPNEINRYANSSDESQAIADEIESLTNELTFIEQQNKLGKELQDRFVSAEQVSLITQIQQLQNASSQSRQQIEQLKQDIQSAKKTLDRKEKELKEVGSLASALQTKLSKSKNELENEKAQRTTNFDSPVLRATTKTAKAFVVKRGRLYNIGTKSGLPAGFTVNEKNFEKATPTDAEVNLGSRLGSWKTRKTGGIPIDNEINLKGEFAGMDPQNEFVHLVVFEDSFENFSSLRQVVVERKLDYSLILLKDGEQVVETTTSQRPKVQ